MGLVMRIIGFGLLLFALVSCTQHGNEETSLSGMLENASETNIEFTYFREYLNNDRVVIDLEPDADNIFIFSLHLDKPLSGWLRVGRTEIPVYLEPGDKLTVEGDAETILETLIFSGKGSDHNNFLLAYQQEIESTIDTRYIASLAGSLEPERFRTVSDSITDIKLQYIDAWKQEQPFSPGLDFDVRTRIKYEKYTMLLEYPLIYQRSNQLDVLPEIPASYYTFLQDDMLFDDARLENLTYTGFLLAYINHVQRSQSPSDDRNSMNQQIYRTALGALDGRSRDFIQALMVGRELSYGVLEEAKDLYLEYISGNADNEYKNRLTAIYEKMEQLTKGNPAPNFTMTDIHGKDIALNDFLGKVVVMDFWASWCGPCMREMPHMKTIKEALADQEDLVFVYISIDTDVNSWKNTVERVGIEGVHFNTPGRERGVPALYNVKWIPSFYVIGRDGNIFDNRPPMPSSGQLQGLLLDALGTDS
jgi:thiol-disulfide isomerase/thioredoxin